MTNKLRINKIIKHIQNRSRSLKLEGGKKKWFTYELDIQELTWARNLVDGYNVFVFHLGRHIGNIHIDGNLDKITSEAF